MANKLYNDTSIKAIADAIRAKNGKTDTYTAGEMAGAISGLSGKESVTWNQCPEAVRNYLANVTYDPSDYSTTQITNYAPATAIKSNTKPIGKTVDGVTYYNEVPNVETPFASENAAGTLKPLDQLRWLNTVSTDNVRDLGGWVCDGGTVKYGMLIRGGEPNAADKNLMVNEVGVRCELNLRGNEGEQRDYSVWGIEYSQPAAYAWYSISDKTLWAQLLKTVINAVTHDLPLYFHCAAGADRTGTLACVLEAILGMSQSDIDKDYELTSFSTGTGAAADLKARNSTDWTSLINAIKAIPTPSGVADTFRNHAIYFAASCGITESEINAFRAAMIDGTPEAIVLSLNNYTITKNTINITLDSDIASVTAYQGYEVNLTPDNGYVISNISVTMGGEDVSSYFKGISTNLNRRVLTTLTNCTTDNDRIYAINGQSFAMNLTADEGYTLDGATITITMGGIDMSTYYSNGTIAIPNVTGDIVITATAVPSAPAYTNQVPLSIGTDGSIYNGTGYKNNSRLNSAGSVVDYTPAGINYCVTGFIPCKAGDVIRFSGCYVSGDDGNAHSWGYTSDKSTVNGTDFTSHDFVDNQISITDNLKPFNWDSNTRVLYSFTVPNISTIAYYRFSSRGMGANAIVTVNEEIV